MPFIYTMSQILANNIPIQKAIDNFLTILTIEEPLVI